MISASSPKFMSSLYVACELGAEKCRILLGALQREGLTVSEADAFGDLTTQKDGELQWDISGIYQHVLRAASAIVAQEEPVRGISFHCSVDDCLPFDSKGMPITAVYRFAKMGTEPPRNKVLSSIPAEMLYEETRSEERRV